MQNMDLGPKDAGTTEAGLGPAGCRVPKEESERVADVTSRDPSHKPGLGTTRSKKRRDTTKVVEVGREVENIDKPGIVSRFLASVKSQDSDDRLRKKEDSNASDKLHDRGSPDRKSRFPAVFGAALRRSKKQVQCSEDGRRYSEHFGRDSHELTSDGKDTDKRERTLNEPISGQNIALRHFHNTGHLSDTSLERTKISVFTDLNKPRTQPNILTDQTHRKFNNRNVTALDTDRQVDVVGRSNRSGSNEGHSAITGKTPESSINLQSTVISAGPTERDIPQSISADSGIGSPTDAASGIGSVEKTVEGEAIKAHKQSDLAIVSADRRAIDDDQPQTGTSSGGPFAPPPPSSVTDVIPIYPLIHPRDRMHPSPTPLSESGEKNSVVTRLTAGAIVDSEPDSTHPAPDQLHRSAAGDTCSPEVIEESIIEKGDSEEDNKNKRLHNSNDTISITPESGSHQVGGDQSLPENLNCRILNVPDTLITSDETITTVSSSAQPDTPTEFTLSNIIRTLISNQNKRWLHDPDESNLPSEQAKQYPPVEIARKTETEVQIEVDGPANTDRGAALDKGVPEKPVRRKLTFRNVSLQDVIALADSPNTDRKIKGILKSTSVPTLSSGLENISDQIRETNGAFKSELPTSRCVSFNKTHIKNTFSYYNDAFEGEVITEPSKRPSLADVVSQIMRQGAIIDMEDDNSHPYGRDTSLTDLITGKRRDNYKMDAGKMIVWLVLAVMLVCLAGGIIFMSETYNLNNAGDNDAVLSVTETTTLSKLPR